MQKRYVNEGFIVSRPIHPLFNTNQINSRKSASEGASLSPILNPHADHSEYRLNESHNVEETSSNKEISGGDTTISEDWSLDRVLNWLDENHLSDFKGPIIARNLYGEDFLSLGTYHVIRQRLPGVAGIHRLMGQIRKLNERQKRASTGSAGETGDNTHPLVTLLPSNSVNSSHSVNCAPSPINYSPNPTFSPSHSPEVSNSPVIPTSSPHNLFPPKSFNRDSGLTAESQCVWSKTMSDVSQLSADTIIDGTRSSITSPRLRYHSQSESDKGLDRISVSSLDEQTDGLSNSMKGKTSPKVFDLKRRTFSPVRATANDGRAPYYQLRQKKHLIQVTENGLQYTVVDVTNLSSTESIKLEIASKLNLKAIAFCLHATEIGDTEPGPQINDLDLVAHCQQGSHPGTIKLFLVRDSNLSTGWNFPSNMSAFDKPLSHTSKQDVFTEKDASGGSNIVKDHPKSLSEDNEEWISQRQKMRPLSIMPSPPLEKSGFKFDAGSSRSDGQTLTYDLSRPHSPFHAGPGKIRDHIQQSQYSSVRSFQNNNNARNVSDFNLFTQNGQRMDDFESYNNALPQTARREAGVDGTGSSYESPIKQEIPDQFDGLGKQGSPLTYFDGFVHSVDATNKGSNYEAFSPQHNREGSSFRLATHLRKPKSGESMLQPGISPTQIQGHARRSDEHLAQFTLARTGMQFRVPNYGKDGESFGNKDNSNSEGTNGELAEALGRTTLEGNGSEKLGQDFNVGSDSSTMVGAEETLDLQRVDVVSHVRVNHVDSEDEDDSGTLWMIPPSKEPKSMDATDKVAPYKDTTSLRPNGRPSLRIDVNQGQIGMSAESISPRSQTQSGATADLETPNCFKASPPLSRSAIKGSGFLHESYGNVKSPVRRSSFTKHEDVWAVRPPAEVVYEHLEDFFPNHDLDKPVIDSSQTIPLSPIQSPTSETPFVPATLSRNRLFSHKKSIRVVAREANEARQRHLSIGGNGRTASNAAPLRRKSTKLWGNRVVEMVPPHAKSSSRLPSAIPESPNSPNSTDKGDMPITFKWVKGELIGKGTYGSVYLGMNLTTGEMMAVKQVELSRGFSIDMNNDKHKAMVEALNSEIETMKDLDHLHIVQYLGCERTLETISIFLEYVPGGSVGRCLRKHGKFEEPVIRSFTRHILEGLSYLHLRGILHRDLKADNILVDLDGCCKISDFGISKKSDNIYGNDANMSMQGTIFWMAPEVVNSRSKGYSAKVDIWSLGCVVLEMFAGRRPWSNQEVIATLFNLGQERKAPPIPDDVCMSEEAEDFLMQCFRAEPDQRPTASELLRHRFCQSVQEFNFLDSSLARAIRFQST